MRFELEAIKNNDGVEAPDVIEISKLKRVGR